jgi:hypothetical protein
MIQTRIDLTANLQERNRLRAEVSYRWATEYSAKEYVDLLGTYSDHISLPEAERSNLFSAITDLIDREYNGRALKKYETVLQLQRKK